MHCIPSTTESYNPVSLEINNSKFHKYVGADAKPDTMERELDHAQMYAVFFWSGQLAERETSEKDKEHTDIDNKVNVANKNLQATETLLSTLTARMKEKEAEVKCKPLGYLAEFR